MLAAWPCVLQRRLKAAAKEEAAEPAGPSLLSPPVGSSTPNTEGTGPQRQHWRHRLPLPRQAAPSSTPSPSQQLRLDPSSCLHKPKPLAFPVQTFPINKWRHHATSPQVTQRRVRGRDGHDHPAPDPLAGRQPCLCLNSRVSKRSADASQRRKKLFLILNKLFSVNLLLHQGPEATHGTGLPARELESSFLASFQPRWGTHPVQRGPAGTGCAADASIPLAPWVQLGSRSCPAAWARRGGAAPYGASGVSVLRHEPASPVRGQSLGRGFAASGAPQALGVAAISLHRTSQNQLPWLCKSPCPYTAVPVLLQGWACSGTDSPVFSPLHPWETVFNAPGYQASVPGQVMVYGPVS